MLASTTTSDQTFSRKWKCDPLGGWGPLLLGAIVHMWMLPTDLASFFSQNSIKLYLSESEMNTWLFNISILASIYEAVEKRIASLESKPSGMINDYLTDIKLSSLNNCALVKCKKTSPGIRFQYWGKVTPTAIAAIGCQLLWNNTLINGSVHDIQEMHSADLRERSMDWIV